MQIGVSSPESHSKKVRRMICWSSTRAVCSPLRLCDGEWLALPLISLIETGIPQRRWKWTGSMYCMRGTYDVALNTRQEERIDCSAGWVGSGVTRDRSQRQSQSVPCGQLFDGGGLLAHRKTDRRGGAEREVTRPLRTTVDPRRVAPIGVGVR